VHACAHCGERTLTLTQKALCSSRFPAQCPRCSGNSFVPQWWSISVGAVLGIALVGTTNGVAQGQGFWRATATSLALLAAAALLAIAARAPAPLRRSVLQGDHAFRRTLLAAVLFLAFTILVSAVCGALIG
jgi:hypothetical protein